MPVLKATIGAITRTDILRTFMSYAQAQRLQFPTGEDVNGRNPQPGSEKFPRSRDAPLSEVAWGSRRIS
jgi:hypothetical protein